MWAVVARSVGLRSAGRAGGAATAQLDSQFLQGAHDQGLELADGGYPGQGGAAPGGRHGP
jgi:hypothetical protein